MMVTYGGGHVNMMIPLIRHLKAYPQYQIEILALTTAGPVLEGGGIPYYGMRHFVEDQGGELTNDGKATEGVFRVLQALVG